MGNNEDKTRHSKRRQRNFIAKKLREDNRFRKKIHIDAKTKQKESRWDAKEISEDYS